MAKPLPPQEDVEELEWKKFVDHWSERRLAEKSFFQLRKREMMWLARCARNPELITAKEVSSRLALLFSEFPDEAGDLWSDVRREVQKKLAANSKVAVARKAVRIIDTLYWFRDHGPSREQMRDSIWSGYDEKGGYWRRAQSEIEANAYFDMIDRLPKGRDGEGNPFGWSPKDVEAYLEKYHSHFSGKEKMDDWSATVEDAIPQERGEVSGKKKK